MTEQLYNQVCNKNRDDKKKNTYFFQFEQCYKRSLEMKTSNPSKNKQSRSSKLRQLVLLL